MSGRKTVASNYLGGSASVFIVTLFLVSARSNPASDKPKAGVTNLSVHTPRAK